ncbi:protein zwilch homolog [Octopus sinensis]|uniref:Protein zwilch n=1 Tax=Octopus sinensis TaxID=2607531 RepID=A0A6P7SYH0_9MOLL|nr:protein zwilch homolog [Octopus sinensis]
MDIKLIPQFQECLGKLLKSPTTNNNVIKFQDTMLYIVDDVSLYGDLDVLQNICSFTLPFIVVCLGRKDNATVKTRNNPSDSNLSDVLSPKSDISDDNNSLYEGSPLEMKEYADLNRVVVSPLKSVYVKNQSSFLPISLSCSKRVLSAFCSLMLSPKYSVSKEERIPILVYCNGEDLLNTAFVYVSPEVDADSNNMLLYSRITVAETTSNLSSISSTSDSFPENMRQLHNRAEYHVFDSSTASNNDQSEEASKIILETEWNKSMKYLDKPSPEVRVTVKVKIVPGDKTGPTYKKFQEFSTLRGFFEGFSKGKVNWLMSESESTTVIDDLKNLFEHLKLGDADIDDNLNENENNEEIPHKISMFDRKDQDFSDKVWNVLMNCHSYEELVDCLNYMFDELQCKNIQPLVHKTNKTRIAELVRSSYMNSMDSPDLEGYVPLKLLIDIGIEKLYNDYISMLVSNELATLDQLQFYTDRAWNIQERMSLLEKLHIVYELVTLLDVYLKLPHSTLSSTALTTLKHFTSNPLESKQTFEFSVPVSCINSFLDKSQPYFWKTIFENVEDSSEQMTISFFSVLPIDHVLVSNNYPDEPSYYTVKVEQHSMSL